jgi:hypothetical protein
MLWLALIVFEVFCFCQQVFASKRQFKRQTSGEGEAARFEALDLCLNEISELAKKKFLFMCRVSHGKSGTRVASARASLGGIIMMIEEFIGLLC